MKRATCVFCPAAPTNKKGEHIFDDWLNRIDGQAIKDKYIFKQTDKDGRTMRQYTSAKINSTAAVVCDTCNNGWMSDLSNEMKSTAERFIRREESAVLELLDLLTISSFVFMKAAVLDAQAHNDGNHPTRHISRMVARSFARDLVPPLGTQVWLAWFRNRNRMATRLRSNSITLKSSIFSGYRIYAFTYVVGHLGIQVTYPYWTKTRRPGPVPFVTQSAYWNQAAVPIWPDVATAQWPPDKHLNDDTLESFKDRFGSNLHIAKSLA